MKIIQPEATEEEIDHLLRHSSSGDLTTLTILKSNGKQQSHAALQDAFQHINNKYHEVVLLEASIAELHKMFEEFAFLVEEQSELLDNIEFQVLTSKDFIADGLDETEGAIKLQRKLRKRRCCVIVVCLSIGLIGLLLLKGGF